MVAKQVNLGSELQPGSWELELLRRIVTFVARKGSLVDARPSEYGWQGYDTGEREHVAECGVHALRCTWQDLTWTEFQGTFAEPAILDCQGVEAVVTCACGLVEDERFRYGGSYGDLLRSVTG